MRSTESESEASARARLDLTRLSCSTVDDMEPQALGMTYWIEDPSVLASAQTIRFTGRHAETYGTGQRSFVLEVPVGRAPAGPVAVTARARGVAPGDWLVEATTLPADPARRSWQVGAARGRTGFEPPLRVLAPGVRLYAWPGFVSLGTGLALVTQFLLASARGLPAGRLLAVTLAACLVGAVGAKAYYVLTHRTAPRRMRASGMSIQGFVLAAVFALVGGALATGVPVGAALDVTTPGLLLGMMVGRFGCFFGGCCAGRPTASRWGLWSSDRVVGVRRVPVQLMESAVAGVLAAGSAAVLLALAHPADGVVFLMGVGAYTFARQLLFPLRAIPRSTSYGRAVVMTSTAVVTTGAGLTHAFA